jgi:methyl-accepting chemotaxis protein
MFGIRTRLLAFGAITWIVVFGIYGLYTYWEKTAQMENYGITMASALSSQIMADREIYASAVVERVEKAGLEVRGSYLDSGPAIPEHLTYVRDPDTQGSLDSFYVSLVSNDPLNEANRVSDTFQFEALNVFSSGADTKHYRFENYHDKYSIRYMVPDFATSTACVSCHNRFNRHPEAVVRDFKLGSILGALEVVVPLEDIKITMAAELRRSLIYGFAVIVIMGVLGFGVLSYTVSTPAQNLIEAARSFSEGDLTKEVALEGPGEFRTLARESSEAIKNIEAMIKAIGSNSEESILATESITEMCRDYVEGAYKQSTALHTVTSGMENINVSTSEIGKGTGAITVAVERGISISNELGNEVSEMAENIDIITTDLTEVSQRSIELNTSSMEFIGEIEGLATTFSSLSNLFHEALLSLNEVEKKTIETSDISGGLIEEVKSSIAAVEKTVDGIGRTKKISVEATEVIKGLSERVIEIGRVMDVIRTVSEETNLLALNAAIIATKSGKYGKSFSVVAGEITELAERTTTSTKEVLKVIDALEADSKKATDEMAKELLSIDDDLQSSMKAGEDLKSLSRQAALSKSKIDEVLELASKVGRETRSPSTMVDKLDGSTSSLLARSREQAREFGITGDLLTRLKDISFKVKESVKEQVNSNQEIGLTVEDLNRMVAHINDAVHSQSLVLTRILLNVEGARGLSVKNIDKARDTEEALERLSEINSTLRANIDKFKLKG